MFGAVVRFDRGLLELCPGDTCNVQDSMFASESTSLLGLVLREAGPVVPSTWEVVRTKVA